MTRYRGIAWQIAPRTPIYYCAHRHYFHKRAKRCGIKLMQSLYQLHLDEIKRRVAEVISGNPDDARDLKRAILLWCLLCNAPSAVSAAVRRTLQVAIMGWYQSNWARSESPEDRGA